MRALANMLRRLADRLEPAPAAGQGGETDLVALCQAQDAERQALEAWVRRSVEDLGKSLSLPRFTSPAPPGRTGK